MKRLILILAIALSACATVPEKEVVVETNYVVRTASADQKKLPPYPDPIDVKTADQSQLATWIAASEDRQRQLERITLELVKFYEAPVAPPEAASAPAQGASK
jgi:hypothetical protein